MAEAAAEPKMKGDYGPYSKCLSPRQGKNARQKNAAGPGLSFLLALFGSQFHMGDRSTHTVRPGISALAA
jgi:hypothetical protein